MGTPRNALRVPSMPATVSPPPRGAGRHGSGRHGSVRRASVGRSSVGRSRVPRWWRDAFGGFVWSSMLVVVGLWVSGGGVQGLAGLGTGLTSVGRLSGLVASDLL